jgi:hypothetical protein
MRHPSAEQAVGAATATSSVVSAAEHERLRAAGAFICRAGNRLQTAIELFRSAPIGPVESEVSGVSMGDVIPHGARIRIAALDAGFCSRLTVVAYIADGRTVVHRVRWARGWGRGRDFLITQGDAMLLPDIPVNRSAVLGTVLAVESNGTWQPLASRPAAPRRERILSFAVLLCAAVLLEIDPRLASWFLAKLVAAERRYSWTRALLY